MCTKKSIATCFEARDGELKACRNLNKTFECEHF